MSRSSKAVDIALDGKGCDSGKDFEMRRLSWNVQMGPYATSAFTGEGQRQTRQMDPEEKAYAEARQGMPAAPRSRKT